MTTYYHRNSFFFFQAEDGIRDATVTGVRRVLFRSIIVTVAVWPEAVWHLGTHKQRFDLVLAGMLSDPTLKLVSRHSYELDGCPAESITCFYTRPGGTSHRMDCFLAEPNVFMLAYVSSNPSSWDDPASKAFFQTISRKPKK